jgi:hypothetical protein
MKITMGNQLFTQLTHNAHILKHTYRSISKSESVRLLHTPKHYLYTILAQMCPHL